MPERQRLDLADVVRARLMEAGLGEVSIDPPSAMGRPESTVVRLGVPGADECYFDMSFDTPVRITVIVRRLQGIAAASDAQEAERALRTMPLDSANGSYRMVSIDTTAPRPVRWDESGRDVWAVEAVCHIERSF